jgi:Bacterial Ig domain
VSPDGTLRPDLDSIRAESTETGSNNSEENGIGTQVAALPDGVLPVVVPSPPAGERVEVDLDNTPVVRLAVDLTGAQVDVADGKIVVTLANGGIIVLEGDVVQQFLAGGDAAIDQFLTAAAGNQDAPEIVPAGETSGSSFQRSGPVPTFASLFDAAGALGATELSYGAVELGQTTFDGAEGVGEPIPPRNNPPVADADATLTVAEDSGNSALGISAPTDADGDPLTITVTGIPNAAIGTVYLADGVTAVANGMMLTAAELTGLVFRPAADANGAAGSFSYSVTDGNGGSDSQTVALNVMPVNDAPVADADKTVTVAEDSSNSALGIAAPTDIDGDPLTITVTGVPNAAVGTIYLADGVTAVTNGTTLTSAELTGLVFRPAADATGAAGSFSYTVTDGNGGTDSQTVSLNVTPVNDAPVADADKTVTVAEDSGNSSLGIVAPTDVDGDPLTITVTGVPNAAVGTVYLSDGVTAVTNGMNLTAAELTGLVFRPVADANGAAGSFSYTVSDGNGGSDGQIVALNVAPVNDAPVADPDKTVTVAEDSANTALGIAAPTDIDGDSLTITVTGIPNAAVGTVYLADGVTAVTNGMALTSAQLTGLLFRPVADANGAAGSFSYTVSDGNGGADSQIVAPMASLPSPTAWR